jgi:hypothetical protein
VFRKEEEAKSRENRPQRGAEPATSYRKAQATDNHAQKIGNVARLIRDFFGEPGSG